MVTVEHLFCFVCFLFRHFFGDKRSQLFAITGCSARGLFGPLSSDAQPPAVLAFEGVKIGRSGVPFSVKWGTNAVKQGYRINFVDFVGYTPPTPFSQRGGGQVAPSFAAAPFAPIPCPKKRKGMRARHGLLVSCQRVRNEL